MSQLYSYSRIDFTCDNCQGEYEEETAYSLARNLKELSQHHTYCSNCVEVSETKYSNIDGRSLNKTSRTYQLGTRVRKEFLEKLKRIAYEEGLKMVEVLEKSLECYERCKNS